MAATIGPADEFAHEPDAPEGENWQENYVWHCWDAQRRSGWYLHLGRIRDHGIVDVRAMTIIDGVVASATLQEPGSDCLAASGLDIDIAAPLERLRIRYAGTGAVGPDGDGFYGARSGDVGFGFDIEMISGHPPVNWSPHDEIAGFDLSFAGNRYEQGARWQGRLWIGDQDIEAQGLLVRDHSWGRRRWTHSNVGGFWIPMVFDGGRRFISGICSTRGAFQSFTVMADENGVVDVSYDNWVRFNAGSLVPRQFDKAEVMRILGGRMQRYRYDGHIHLAFARHASFTDTRHRFGIADMYSTITGPDGLAGFGTLQHFTRSDYAREGFESERARTGACS